MTKIYSNAPKDGLRCCIGSEVMNRKLLECAAVLRPLDVPSTFWKYGKILSHSAVLCITKKEYVLVEYSSDNMVHINTIGGFQNKESEIGPYFEYRGFIFHYITPLQKPNKRITIRDFALKMASFACKKPYEVFTNNCHQARYLTMKYYGMKSHDPYNIKVNILFQGFADYFTEYNAVKVKKNIDFVKETYLTESPAAIHSSSTTNFFNENFSKSSLNKNNKINNKAHIVRCSSTQDISKHGNRADKSKEQLFSHNIHIDDEYYSESSSIIESSSLFLTKERRNSSVHPNRQQMEFAKKVTPLRRSNSNTHIPKIKNPYRQLNKKQSESSSTSLESTYLMSTSDSSSSHYQQIHQETKKNIFDNKPVKNEKSESPQIKKSKYLNAKTNTINYPASENIPELANTIQNSPIINKKK